MSENLGRATVYIGTDLGDLQKGLKQAQAEVASAAKAMTIAIGAVTAVFTAGVTSALSYGEEISKLSAITGVSTEMLSRLRYTAEQNETSFGALTSGIKILTRNVDEANRGNERMTDNFSHLGIAASDLRGMKIDQMIFSVADKFKTLTDDSQRAALAMQIFGRSGADLIPILKLGSDGIKSFFEASDKLGNTLSGTDAKALKEFNDSIQDMQKYLRGIWTSIAVEVGPAFENFFSALQKSNILKDISVIFKDMLKSVAELPGWFKLSAAAVVLFGTALGRSFAVLALFPDVSKAVRFWWSAIQEDLALIEKEMIDLGLWLSKITHIPIEGVEEMKEQLAELSAEIERQRNVQVGIVSEPLNIQKMLDDLQKLQSEIDNFNTANTGGVADLGNIKVTPEVDTSPFTAAFGTMRSTIESFKGSWQGWANSLQEFWKNTVKTFETSLSTAISSIILGTKSASEAFKDFGKTMITTIVEFVVQYAVQAAVAMVIGNMVLGTVNTIAAAMAGAWGPAATLASIATRGGAASAGTMAVGGALAASAGMVGAAKAAIPIYAAAEGGIFEKPSLTWIAEKEPEAAIPLSRLNSVAPQNGGNPIYITVENPIVTSTVDIEELVKGIDRGLARGNYANGLGSIVNKKILTIEKYT